MFVINGIKSTKPNEFDNGFCNYFSTVASSSKQTSYPLIDFTWRKPLNQPLRTYKLFHFWSTGLIKDSASVISAPLALIINLSFRSGVFPPDYKIEKILPLYKNGGTNQFGNYRPISILPIISQVVEKIVHNRLVDYLSENKVLSKRQFGFPARKSTELAVTL